jgi:DNA-binding CsgD family transcriptional regulator
MRSRNDDLTSLQLQITMHLANGMTFEEIANYLDRSKSYIQQNANAARYKMNARTLPQLVSIVIAAGQLEWQANQRVLIEAHVAPDSARTPVG